MTTATREYASGRAEMAKWFNRYEHNTPLFAYEVLCMDEDDFQAKLFKAYDRGESQISIRSGHGVGKSSAFAAIVIHHSVFRFPQKTICTSSSEGQLFPNLANEVKIWIGKLPEKIKDTLEVQTEQVYLKSAPEQSFISYRVAKSDKPESIAGGHSPNMLIIVDEASGVPDVIFETLLGSTTGAEGSVTMMLAGNMVRNSGFFYDSHFKASVAKNWFKIHRSCLDSPRVSRKYIDSIRDTYGERSNQFRVRVEGNPPLADADAIIPFEICELALDRDVLPIRTADVVWGFDVARFGDDACALIKRRANALIEKGKRWWGLDTMQAVSRLKDEWDVTPKELRPTLILIDVIGMGAAIVDRGRELQLPVRGINVSELPAQIERYRNLRTELYFHARTWLEKRDCTLLGDEDLAKELPSVRYDFATTSEKVMAESKKAMRSRGVASPNLADAFILTFAGPSAMAAGGGQRSNWKKPFDFRLRSIA